MSKAKKLEELREKIDSLDKDILKIISERGQIAQEIAKVKTDSSEPHNFYRPEREAQILRKIIENNKGPLSEEEMVRLFREIMSACLALEQVLDIAYLGPEGTFTQTAALKHFGSSVNTSAFGTIDQVFREVESNASHYGVVPIENSIEGIVNHTLDMLNHSSLMVCGEVELRIHHHLLSKNETIDEIKKVYSDIEVIDWGVIKDIDLVINATSLGLNETDVIDIDLKSFGKNKLFYDLIYNPPKTNFLQKAEKLGNQVENGKMMFAYQAQLSFSIWNGVEPKVDEKVLKILND